MTGRHAREQRLAALQHWAEKIPPALDVLHERHGHHVHLRPTTGGVTLLGLTPDRPQRGKGGLRNLDRLVADFDRLFEQYCVPASHGRDTSEKAIQSALIRDAYAHGRQMQLFGAATAGTNDELTPLFVADELSLPHDDGEVCCDLLALRPVGAETYRPVVIELKWKRQMKRLVEQVTTFANFVDEQQKAFESLARTLVGRPVQLEAECERWIVWPPPESTDKEPREAELASAGIRVFTYRWDGNELRLRGWSAPDRR